MIKSPGLKFREALTAESPLQVVGCINAYSAIMAEKVGFQAIYLSGSGVAAASYGFPDLGITDLNDVLADVRRLTAASDVPLLVDIDTGFGNAFQIQKTIVEMTKAGVAAVHIEDQHSEKRCGHRPDKKLVDRQEMVSRIEAAVTAKTDPNFVIMARSDALANEGMEALLARLQAYVAAGADMVFPEAVVDLAQYQHISEAIDVPVLANITEFGKTELYTVEELKNVGVAMVLYPLSAFRAMSQAALNVYQDIRQNHSQKQSLDSMQTREALYQFLDYYTYERRQNNLFKEDH